MNPFIAVKNRIVDNVVETAAAYGLWGCRISRSGMCGFAGSSLHNRYSICDKQINDDGTYTETYCSKYGRCRTGIVNRYSAFKGIYDSTALKYCKNSIYYDPEAKVPENFWNKHKGRRRLAYTMMIGEKTIFPWLGEKVFQGLYMLRQWSNRKAHDVADQLHAPENQGGEMEAPAASGNDDTKPSIAAIAEQYVKQAQEESETEESKDLSPSREEKEQKEDTDRYHIMDDQDDNNDEGNSDGRYPSDAPYVTEGDDEDDDDGE